MRRNKEGSIEKERKAPDNSFRNNRRKAPAKPGHTNRIPLLQINGRQAFYFGSKSQKVNTKFPVFPNVTNY